MYVYNVYYTLWGVPPEDSENGVNSGGPTMTIQNHTTGFQQPFVDILYRYKTMYTDIHFSAYNIIKCK